MVPTRSFEVQTDPVKLPDVPVKIKKRSRILSPPSRSLVEGGISPSPSTRDTSEPALSSPLAAVRAMSFPGATLQEEADDNLDPELTKGSSEVPPSVPAAAAMLEEKPKPPSAKKRNKVEGRNHFTVSMGNR